MKKYFEFDKLGTNYRTEILGGFTTFLAMAYILAVNPTTLTLESIPDLPFDRMDKGSVFVATALAAAIGSLFMGIIAKYPIALAPGMGLNAFFAFTVVLGFGMPWQTALTGVFVSGVFFAILTLTGLRETIINAIPEELKLAVGSGIGLFITFIGLKSAGIVVNNDATLVGIGNLSDKNTLLAIFGLVITVIMMVRKIKGGIFFGMIITAIVGMIFNLIAVPDKVIGSIPSIKPTFGAAFEAFANPSEHLFTSQFLVVVLTILFVDFFDCAGTLMAVAKQAGFVKDNRLPRAGKALFADSIATISGSILGTSTTTSYIESSAGVAAGARSGFAACVTAIFFLLSLFFSPVLSVITPYVTAPALIMVGVLMVAHIGEIDWKKIEIAVPTFLTMITMPLTYSIATGIAIGFVFYPITQIATGNWKKIHPIMYGMFVICICYFVFLLE